MYTNVLKNYICCIIYYVCITSLFVTIYIYIHISIYIYIYIKYIYIYVSIYLSIYLSIYVYIYILIYIYTYIYIYFIYIYMYIMYIYIYIYIYHSQIVHHNTRFNLFILHNSSFDNKGSEIYKNDIFLHFHILSFTKTFYLLHIQYIYIFLSQLLFQTLLAIDVRHADICFKSLRMNGNS